jgi:hypothetical protein
MNKAGRVLGTLAIAASIAACGHTNHADANGEGGQTPAAQAGEPGNNFPDTKASYARERWCGVVSGPSGWPADETWTIHVTGKWDVGLVSDFGGMPASKDCPLALSYLQRFLAQSASIRVDRRATALTDTTPPAASIARRAGIPSNAGRSTGRNSLTRPFPSTARIRDNLPAPSQKALSHCSERWADGGTASARTLIHQCVGGETASTRVRFAILSPPTPGVKALIRAVVWEVCAQPATAPPQHPAAAWCLDPFCAPL